MYNESFTTGNIRYEITKSTFDHYAKLMGETSAEKPQKSFRRRTWTSQEVHNGQTMFFYNCIKF